MSTAIVSITSSPPGDVPISLSAEETQVVSTVVQAPGQSVTECVIIVNANLAVDVRKRIESDLLVASPDATIVFLAPDSKSYAIVVADSARCTDFNIAAAVAVFKASWGWDEGSQMLIRVNDCEIRARVRYDGIKWSVVDEASS